VEIGAGKRWSDSFSKASKRALFFSTGAHGLRHSYAEERMREIMEIGFNRLLALKTVSQEMGHFSREITEVYLQ
jgi:integrase